MNLFFYALSFENMNEYVYNISATKLTKRRRYYVLLTRI